MKKVVYILEFKIYNVYGKYDEKNLIEKVTRFYEQKDRQIFLMDWKRMVDDDFNYDEIKGYGIDYSGAELNLEDMLNSI